MTTNKKIKAKYINDIGIRIYAPKPEKIFGGFPNDALDRFETRLEQRF